MLRACYVTMVPRSLDTNNTVDNCPGQDGQGGGTHLVEPLGTSRGFRPQFGWPLDEVPWFFPGPSGSSWPPWLLQASRRLAARSPGSLPKPLGYHSAMGNNQSLGGPADLLPVLGARSPFSRSIFLLGGNGGMSQNQSPHQRLEGTAWSSWQRGSPRGAAGRPSWVGDTRLT